MVNEDHLRILKQGVAAWNEWREKKPEIHPDLSSSDLSGDNLRKINLRGADLSNAKLANVDFHKADLSKANLSRAYIVRANLRKANLSDANVNEAILQWSNLSKTNLSGADIILAKSLVWADLSWVNLSGRNLTGANFRWVDLTGADLSRVDLSSADLTGAVLRWANLSETTLTEADLTNAQLIETNFENADLTGCRIYGISAWRLKLKGTKQSNLIITPPEEPIITVDNLEVAQFIYLMLHNEKIRDVLNTIGKKGVLILGRFTPTPRKEILDAIREKLRQIDYVPIVFDFERPTDRDFTETIMTLAGMCRFIIADITNPRSSPLELQATVPDYMIPFVPIIQKDEKPFAMFKDLSNKYDWVLKPVIAYDSMEDLMKGFEKAIIKPALKMHSELMARKAEELRTEDIGNYL